MKKVISIFLIILLLSGCRATEINTEAANNPESTGGSDYSVNSEQYEFETDMQYYQLREAIKTSRIQNYNAGCFLYHGGFVYKVNVSSGMIMPLCDKANCLHDQEIDAKKRSQCNAWIADGAITSASIMLNRDEIYVCLGPHAGKASSKTTIGSSLIRISVDGHSREVYYENENCEMNPVIAHKGYIYFFGQAFAANKKEISTKLAVQRIELSNKKVEPEIIYDIPDAFEDIGYGFLQAYGKYVYFDLDYTDSSGTHSSLFIYNTESGDIMEREGLGHPSFYQGKLYFHEYNSEEGDDYQTEVYCTNLMGEDRETVFTEVPQGYYVVGDEQYLYLNNAMMVTWGDLTEKQYWVYDKDLNPVDQFTVPDTDTSYLDPPIGGTDYQYEIFDDPDTGEWGVLVWDKSKIGSYNGAAFEQQRIVYGAK